MATKRMRTTCFIATLIAKRLTGLQCKCDPPLCFSFAAQGEKCLPLEIQQILLAHQRPSRHLAAAENVSHPARNLLVVLRREARFAHHEDSRLKHCQHRS